MAFEWMHPSSTPIADRAAARLTMYRREVAQRAALLYRLGYPVERAIARLQANADWDFEVGADRPIELSAEGIAEIARATYARRPSH
ncbi:MAG: hypothetical protein AAGC55_13555 [Myxococcota bacterium]